MYMILLDASPANLECGKHSGKRMYRDDRNLGKLKHLVDLQYKRPGVGRPAEGPI